MRKIRECNRSETLIKVLKTYITAADSTIDVATQLFVRSKDPNISREHSSNYIMLRCDLIDTHFSLMHSLRLRNLQSRLKATRVVNFL